MSKKHKDRLEKSAKKQDAQEVENGKVLMRFKNHQYYNDLGNPIFLAGEIYELEGAGWIQRWVKRGGEIISKEEATKKYIPSSQPESIDPSGLNSPRVEAPQAPKERGPEETWPMNCEEDLDLE